VERSRDYRPIMLISEKIAVENCVIRKISYLYKIITFRLDKNADLNRMIEFSKLLEDFERRIEDDEIQRGPERIS